MTIGQQLKKTRLLFGLTQEEMSAGIVSKSFYSRVERDKNAITINKLIAMLNA
ncbi:helix-turn-helix domain-containing protein, partial [Lactobacillus helveticus]